MLSFPFHTIDTANQKSKALLQSARKRIGYIPNIYNMMANSAGLLEMYLKGDMLFRSGSGFTPPEKEMIYLTISHENNCKYCVAVHSTLAGGMSRVPKDVIKAVLSKVVIPDKKLSALSEFTRVMVISRGIPDNASIESFFDAGYTKEHILEIILAIAVKTISNYSNHLFQTPIDERFSNNT